MLFLHLSRIWQVANILSTTHLLNHLLFSLENPFFPCVIDNLRQFQTIILALCMSLLSVTRFFAHFHPNLYLNVQHKWIGYFSAIVLMVATFLLLAGVKVASCNILDVCQMVNPCYSIFLRRLFILMFSVVAFFNCIIFLELLRKKCPPEIFILPKILPFHGSMPSSPEAMEIPTISSNIQPHLPTINQSEMLNMSNFLQV